MRFRSNESETERREEAGVRPRRDYRCARSRLATKRAVSWFGPVAPFHAETPRRDMDRFRGTSRLSVKGEKLRELRWGEKDNVRSISSGAVSAYRGNFKVGTLLRRLGMPTPTDWAEFVAVPYARAFRVAERNEAGERGSGRGWGIAGRGAKRERRCSASSARTRNQDGSGTEIRRGAAGNAVEDLRANAFHLDVKIEEDEFGTT